MKKYLFIALALLGMASCAKDDLGNGNKPHHNGEVEESYIAINLMAADSGTRGTSGTNANDYEEGTDAERVVNTAYFFFFDAVGNPFYVNTTNTPATGPGTNVQTNHLALSISEVDNPASEMPNVSDIKKAVLILETYKGVYPSQIVAVINWVPTENAYSLDDLHDALVALNGTNGFVMSNSVYMDGAGKMVDAVPLTAANIKTSADEAKAAPVEIYVERVAAKVVLTASGKVTGTTNIFDTQKDSSPLDNNSVTTSPIDVYVQLHGWELYNDHSTSNLLKNIDPAWGDGGGLGLTWNDRFKFRSYWAISQDKIVLNDKFAWQYTSEKQTEKGFKTEYGFAVASDATYTDATTYTYCGENTGVSTIDGEGKVTPYNKNTKVILKGQLMQSDGHGGYETLELARWYGTDYAGEEALRIAVANSLKYTLFSSPDDGINFDSIKPEDLMCVAGSVVGADAYEVGFQLSSADGFGTNKTWYQYNSTQGYVKFGNPDTYADNAVKTNEYLKTVQPALLYKAGQTYYIVDIEHFGTQTAAYGVVRNHVYQIDINSITGYGSPVYSGTGDIVNPEYPEDEDESSYVAARINILSWKIVKQTVDIVK